MKFQIGSSIFQFLDSLVDFVLLNLIFLVTCIPIITIGPSLSALLSVTMQEARGEHGYMIRSYIKAWKNNFKTSFLLFLFYLITGAILLFNFSFWLQLHSIMSHIAIIVLTLCAILYLLSLLYSFALDARFENSIRQTLKNSVLLALSHLKQTGILLLIVGIAVIILSVTPPFRAFMLIFGFAFLAYCASFPLIKVFHNYEPDEC